MPPKVESEYAIGDNIIIPNDLTGIDTNGIVDLFTTTTINTNINTNTNTNTTNNNNNNKIGIIKDIVYTSVETIYVITPDKEPGKVLYLLSSDLNK